MTPKLASQLAPGDKILDLTYGSITVESVRHATEGNDTVAETSRGIRYFKPQRIVYVVAE